VIRLKEAQSVEVIYERRKHMTNRSLFLAMLVLALLLPQALIAQVDPPEIRAAWVYGFNSEFSSASATTTTINNLADNNFNIVIPEVRKQGDAYYNSAYEPWASDVATGYDPLLDMVNKAHARNMEVYPWIVTYRIWPTSGTPPNTHIWKLHPEWAMKNSSGSTVDGNYYDLDPGVPGVQDYLSKVVIDIISKYDVDGFNFDYIRYPTYTWGYNAISKARFTSETGYAPPTTYNLSDPHWVAWSEWRKQQVTDLVKKCYLEAMWRKPHIKMTADTIGWMGNDPNVDFHSTRAYTEVFQDAKTWMEQGFIDMNILMNYKRDWMTGTAVNGYSGGNQRADHRLWSNWLASMQESTGRQAVDGIAGYLNVIPGILTQWGYSRANGIGLCNFRYGFTTGLESSTPGIPVFPSYGSGNPKQGSDTLFFSTIKANMFQNPAPIPEMPWKTNPQTGIVFGNVTNAAHPNDPTYQNWVYKATITLTGPYPSTATQTASTDATGTFGFMSVAPGTYSVSAYKAGLMSRTYTSQIVRAGDVIREDFDLGTTTVTSPAGTVLPEWSWFSLPLEPVNPAAEAVLPGWPIDANLFRWDAPTQSQVMYDMWRPDIFGDLQMGDGYMYRDGNSRSISYQAYSGGPAQRDVSIPLAGMALIGCPFDRSINWEKALVTKNGVTVDIRTATKTNNWMQSIGFWWNAAEQSQYDMGFWDDWPSGGTTINPWRAYWIVTFTDGLTLHLRQSAPE
jgi:uncharacterized lipoprotein YddW (UPF0748 family)